jgi:hypothetical protein
MAGSGRQITPGLIGAVVGSRGLKRALVVEPIRDDIAEGKIPDAVMAVGRP